ncbi:prepilin-type N-terminal cleavage/methylation domain-containing protein [Opitutaceae bacterium TAV4]|nr:prepilin-type N-terminal cleavage/methylation domain-containing protein [Opitutaceae bacterium TAV3]RRK01405.1 prepilin-type N-terminal cleavage/methylation domain-containing protein [Opitutaceae bacterium TAV4]
MKTRAFTLIELLTVIAIIGILAAIIIPTVATVRRTARNAQCISNLRQVAQAGQLWITENRGHMPDCNGWRDNETTNPQYSLRPYLDVKSGKRTNALTCPETLLRHPAPFGPSPDGLTDNLRTYSINQYACRTQGGEMNATMAPNPKNITNIQSPGKTSFFMDGALISEKGGVRQYVHADLARPSLIWTEQKPEGLLAVHKGRLNVAFIDCHVESRHPSTIPTRDSEGSYDKAKKHLFWGSGQ